MHVMGEKKLKKIPWGGGGVLPYFLLFPSTRWGHIFTTGLTIMGSHIFGFFWVRQCFLFTVSGSSFKLKKKMGQFINIESY